MEHERIFSCQLRHVLHEDLQPGVLIVGLACKEMEGTTLVLLRPP